MRFLGLSAFYHDSAAAIVEDGRIAAAAQEERFTRKKHDPGFPRRAIEYCLAEAECRLSDIDFVVFYDKPFLKFERLLETYVALVPRGFNSFRTAMPVWLGQKLFLKHNIQKSLSAIDNDFDGKTRLLFTEHHLSHSASAFYPSPFDEAAILTLDGVGEWATTSLGVGKGNHIEIQKEIHFPHSLGLLYSAFTYYTGFKVNSGEYKLMGLAPYGVPKYVNCIFDNLIDVKPDGSFRLDQEYFDYCTGLRMTNAKFDALFGRPARTESEPITQYHMDIAASIQAATNDIVLRLARSARNETGLTNLCMAGGVALNCVANGLIHKAGIFDNIWIQPAAGDAGGALGAALAGAHLYSNMPRRAHRPDSMQGSYLGPKYSLGNCETELVASGAVFRRLSDDDLTSVVASALADGKAIGWMQGRMEFGPRSLGNRSILGDPRSPTMQRLLNLKVKYRESFRPFAPSVLREDVNEWFELQNDSPYMLLVASVKEKHRRQMTSEESALFGIDKINIPRSSIPAVTHIDYSARIQTVDEHTNPRFHKLISKFKEITGVGVLVNTSFNVRNEPIVCSPTDAFRCFMGSEIDMLVVENLVMDKDAQNSSLRVNYQSEFEND